MSRYCKRIYNMIALFLIDIILFNTTKWIPCFFLIGFVGEKKNSIFSLLTISLVYDFLFYSTYGFFFITLLLFEFIKKILKKKVKNKYLILNLYQIFFFFFLILITKSSYTLMFQPKIYNTLVWNNIFLFLIIKMKKAS